MPSRLMTVHWGRCVSYASTLQNFQYGISRAKAQPRSPTTFGNTTATQRQCASTSSPASQAMLMNDQAQVALVGSPDSHSKGASISSEAQTTSRNTTDVPTKVVKRKRSSKADPLPSLQDAPGLPEKLGDQPLRLIIVGHNPSDHAW